MLVEFSVENFLSFNERVTLSLLAAPELDEADGLVENTFEAPGGVRLLKSALIYGANASGKSNLIEAVRFASRFVMNSAKETQAGEPIEVKPFLLDQSAEKRGAPLNSCGLRMMLATAMGFPLTPPHPLGTAVSLRASR